MSELTVGHFPYRPGFNPYQRLFSEALEAAGVRVVRIPGRKFTSIQFALRQRTDLLHTDWPHSFYTGRNWLATRIKRFTYARGLTKLRRHPLVWTAHNLIAHDAADPRDEVATIQRLIDCCDGIFVTSGTAEELLRRTYRLGERTRVAVVPHGHYIDAYPNDVSCSAARAELAIPLEARVVLFLGRIRPYKGVDALVRAFGQVARRPDVLLVAGPSADPRLPAELADLGRRCLPPGVALRLERGLVPDVRLQVYFNACDVVAYPFRRILSSGSLLLAMSFARCVVAPRLGSIPEVACPAGYFGYDAGDPDGLAAALRRALDQPDLPARGEAAKAFARRNYDWKDIGQKARRLCEDVAHRA